MKKIIAIKRNDNGVTWLSGWLDIPEQAEVEDVIAMHYSAVDVWQRPGRFVKLPLARDNHESVAREWVYYPLDKAESVELRDYNEDSYEGTCGG